LPDEETVSMSKTVHGQMAVFFARLKGDVLEVVKSGGRGRPVSITIEECANQYQRTLPKGARAVAEAAPFQALAALLSLRRKLTSEEKEFLAESTDAQFQTLRDGEPAQNDINLRYVFPLATGDVAEVVQGWVENVVFPSVALAAKHSGREVYINLERWAIERNQRGAKAEHEAQEGLKSLTAKYQLAVYATDSPAKKGFISLATVLPSGKVIRKYEDPEKAARSERARNAALAGAEKRRKATQTQVAVGA